MNDKSVTNLINMIENSTNAYMLETDNDIAKKFSDKYKKWEEKLFYRVIKNTGGIVIDNWVRLYGSGSLNIIEKNRLIDAGDFDILIGEDVCGGLFALKENKVYYYASDTLEWESLNIYYTDFLSWLLDGKGPNKFYESFRWTGWEKFCESIKLNEGISFVPQLCFESKMQKRSKRIIKIDEIIGLNFELSNQIHMN